MANNYFNKDTVELIKQFQLTRDSAIWDKLQPIFTTQIESIYSKFYDSATNDSKRDTVTELSSIIFLNIDKLDCSKPVASLYGYINTIVKNFIIYGRIKFKNYSEKHTSIDVVDDDKENQILHTDYDFISNSDKLNEIIVGYTKIIHKNNIIAQAILDIIKEGKIITGKKNWFNEIRKRINYEYVKSFLITLEYQDFQNYCISFFKNIPFKPMVNWPSSWFASYEFMKLNPHINTMSFYYIKNYYVKCGVLIEIGKHKKKEFFCLASTYCENVKRNLINEYKKTGDKIRTNYKGKLKYPSIWFKISDLNKYNEFTSRSYYIQAVNNSVLNGFIVEIGKIKTYRIGRANKVYCLKSLLNSDLLKNARENRVILNKDLL